jgi:hypothetical protein
MFVKSLPGGPTLSFPLFLPESKLIAKLLRIVVLGAVWASSSEASIAARFDGVLTINVTEEGSAQPLAVRMELLKSGRPVRIRPEGAIVIDGYLVFDGTVMLELKQGNYEFNLDAGPEFQTRNGHFSIERHAEDQTDVTMTRRVNMRAEGWWAGDLDVAQRFDDMPLLMRAAAVDFVPVTVAENDGGKCRSLKQPPNAAISDISPPLFGPWATIDHRKGNGLLFVGGDACPEVCELPASESTLTTLTATSESNTHTVALNANAWGLPIWIASGKLDAVAIMDRSGLITKVNEKNTDGYPRDKKFYPGTVGAGRWNEAIYHHLLNAGIRIAPAAGSGSGTSGNPIGTNRVYAYCGEQMHKEGWLDALKAGQVMVTNGPLLRTTVEGHPPGHVFELADGEHREFQIALSLSFYEKAAVEYLEILKNGEVMHQVRLRELAENKGRLPGVPFKESGWFAVRAMTGNTKVYQYATTGPYYVEVAAKPRISKRSVQFFIDWLTAVKGEFKDNPTMIKDLVLARSFWEEQLTNVTSD